jgi:hypothetical protein
MFFMMAIVVAALIGGGTYVSRKPLQETKGVMYARSNGDVFIINDYGQEVQVNFNEINGGIDEVEEGSCKGHDVCGMLEGTDSGLPEGRSEGSDEGAEVDGGDL